MRLTTKLTAVPLLLAALAQTSGVSASAAQHVPSGTSTTSAQALVRARPIPGLARGWHGILPGQSLQAVASKLGGSYLINADRCPPVALIYSQTNWPEIVASDGQTVDLVEVQDNSAYLNADDTGNSVIQGPGGIHVGQPISRYRAITRSPRVVRHYPGNAQYQFDPYWVLKVRARLYFYVRASQGNVVTFGWTPSLATAVERGRTQGGCY
jgi:hypothetical protein